MFKNMVLIAAVVIGKIDRGKLKFYLIKNNENSDWEIPKLTVRKTESSVRAVLRMIGEQAGMRARILNEASRFTSTIAVNGKTVTQKTFYYSAIHRADSGESVGFFDSIWLEYSKAYKKLSSKREKESISSANKELKEWWKRKKGRAKKQETEE